MVEIYTIGFTKTTAADFFRRLRENGIKRLLDVRLNNRSQLAGFAKRDDLEFFLGELCGARYEHAPLLAPDEDLLKDFKRDKKISWEEYETRFLHLMRLRSVETELDPGSFAQPTVLLCSEDTAEHCHRRLVAEYLQEKWDDVRIIHL